MSYSADETYDLYDERERKARKSHKCSACREAIRKGDRYTRVAVISDGSAVTVKRCARCQLIHLHLRELCLDSYGEMWPEERLDCGATYEGEWGGPPPEDTAALAFALPGETYDDGVFVKGGTQ